jgi:L-serine dehydratase
MDTLRELYKIGNGPSSSHTMGPKKAAVIFKNRNEDADVFEVDLFGSLAATGKGHLTDYVLRKTLGEDKTVVTFKEKIVHEYHPNGMELKAYKINRRIILQA